MKNLQNILLENILRYGVKNLSESDIQRLSLLEQETQEKSLTKRINFPSGMHSAQKGNVAGVLGPQLKEMQDFLVANKGAVVEIILSSSESLVTNYNGEAPDPKKAPLKPGQLSQLRYTTIETYMTQWLQGLLQQGIITSMPTIKKENPVIAGPEWKVIPGETPEQTKQRARSDQYTQHQWLQVTLKVVASTAPSTEIAELFMQTKRSPNSATSNYNASLFYNYSVAPAAVLRVNPESLPGALLTMNREISTHMDITVPKFKLPKFVAKIQPNGGRAVNLLVLPDTVKNPLSMTKFGSTQSWVDWTAYVSNSYSIIMSQNIKEGTIEFENAWAFVYWYIKNSFPSDWNYISNKPANVDFEKLEKMKIVPNKKADASITNQQKWWSQSKTMPDDEGNENSLTMSQWYAKQVAEK